MHLPTTNRVEAFSDGIMAIIITLLILEIKVPEIHGGTLTDFLNSISGLLPKFLSFTFSFSTVAIFWVNHHSFFHGIKKVDHKLIWYNNLLMFWICLLPFSTAFAGDYYTDKYVIAFYCVNMIFAALTFSMMWRYAFVVNIDILNDPEAMEKIPREQREKEFMKRGISGVIVYLICVIIAFFSIPVAVILLFAMQLFYILPSKLERKHKFDE